MTTVLSLFFPIPRGEVGARIYFPQQPLLVLIVTVIVSDEDRPCEVVLNISNL